MSGINCKDPVFNRIYNEARGCHDWEAVTALEAIDRQLRIAQEAASKFCALWVSTAEYRKQQEAEAEAGAAMRDAMRKRRADHRAPETSDG